MPRHAIAALLPEYTPSNDAGVAHCRNAARAGAVARRQSARARLRRPPIRSMGSRRRPHEWGFVRPYPRLAGVVMARPGDGGEHPRVPRARPGEVPARGAARVVPGAGAGPSVRARGRRAAGARRRAGARAGSGAPTGTGCSTRSRRTRRPRRSSILSWARRSARRPTRCTCGSASGSTTGGRGGRRGAPPGADARSGSLAPRSRRPRLAARSARACTSASRRPADRPGAQEGAARAVLVHCLRQVFSDDAARLASRENHGVLRIAVDPPAPTSAPGWRRSRRRASERDPARAGPDHRAVDVAPAGRLRRPERGRLRSRDRGTRGGGHRMKRELARQVVHWTIAVAELSDLSRLASPTGWRSLDRPRRRARGGAALRRAVTQLVPGPLRR